jgi:hypothetical protein
LSVFISDSRQMFRNGGRIIMKVAEGMWPLMKDYMS